MMGMREVDSPTMESLQATTAQPEIETTEVDAADEDVDDETKNTSGEDATQHAGVNPHLKEPDAEETPPETENVPAQIGGSQSNVMEGFEDESCSSFSIDDPYDTCASEDAESKPRRKKFALANHIIVIEDSSPVCYCCTACKSYFSHKHTARNHEFCGSGVKPFKCRLCDKRFVKKSDRDNHHKTHTGERPFVCSICDKSFYLKHKLNRHVRSHTGVKGDFPCSSCSRSFISREALRKHQVNKHNPSKSIQCDNCGKRFEKNEEKQKHKCTRPPKKKKLVCEVCGKTFSKNWNLTVHLRIHVGQRPYKCAICNKSFRLRQHLERHSTKHQADADFECMLCKQTFGRKDNMIRHLKLNHPDRHLGVDIKDMVQRSERAKMAKSKKLSEERKVSEDTEKALNVLPVDKLPNIRFAKMPSESKVVTDVGNQAQKVGPVDAISSKSSGGSSKNSGQKLFESRIERSVILQTVVNSGTSSVLKKVETLRYLQTTVVERVDPFKSRQARASEVLAPQPSVLVFNKSRDTPAVERVAEPCSRSISMSGPGGNQAAEDVAPLPYQQVSVLRFGSSDSNSGSTCQR